MKMLPVAAAVALCAVADCAAAATLVMPPAVPQPSKSGDVVGFILQNPGTTSIPAHMVTYGQVFPVGAVLPTQALAARDSDKNRNVQMDVLATHPDGSVRFAAITMAYPAIAAQGSFSGMLVLRGSYAGAPVDLVAAPLKLTVALTVTSSPLGAFTKTIDLGAALQASLASGSPDYWLHGPQATEARVDVPVGASMHLTADVTGYKNGTIVADVQFNNDLAMGKTGGTFSYGATVTLNGKAQKFVSIVQDQYQDWHTLIATGGGLPAVNVQHDVAYLEKTGAVLTYDLTTGVNTTTLQSYTTFMAQTNGFGTPLAANGVTQGMPNTGARPDIGYTTQFNTVWLLTQDTRAATMALAQGDAGGAAPWNMKLANGRWLTPHDYPAITTSTTDPWHTDLAQGTANTAWTLDPAHQPNLNYVPYLMTASRWNLDRLNAQAAWDLLDEWPGIRCQPQGANCTTSNNWHIINFQDQVRAQSWSSREITEAGWIGKPGSFEAGYFAQVSTNNWKWLLSQIPMVSTAEGQAAMWLPSQYPTDGRIAPWEEDYFTGIVALASKMGDANAQQVLTAMQGWLVGRFLGAGMNPHDGCAYEIASVNPSTNKYYTTWQDIEAGTISLGWSNGSGWAWSGGVYCQLAEAALGAALSVQPTNSGLQQALTWLRGAGAPYTDRASYQADPTFNVVP